MNNIFDDIKKAEEQQNETTVCDHLWIWSEDKQSIYCYDCKLIKYIKPGIPIDKRE